MRSTYTYLEYKCRHFYQSRRSQARQLERKKITMLLVNKPYSIGLNEAICGEIYPAHDA